MTRRRRRRGAPASSIPLAATAPKPKRRTRYAMFVGGCIIAACVVAAALLPRLHGQPAGPSRQVAAATYVGSTQCAECHRDEAKAWRTSQHAAAMQVAGATTVRGDFRDSVFRKDGIDTRFFARDGKWFAHTDGADGTIGDFEVRYTLGVDPLQQYLVAFPDGRLQPLTIAWDTRRATQGGSRWFSLYPHARIDHHDALHWTGRTVNWNFICAECHVTGFAKNYDAAADRYDTREHELGVGCEACHGPGSTHVAWARRDDGGNGYAGVPNKGLTARLDERAGIVWKREAGAAIASRSRPRTSEREIDVCAQCHARRAPIARGYAAGKPFLDYHRPELLKAPVYHADGQQRAEDYDWGSFLQSRMYAAGVTCSDCHEPHTGKLRASGNAVCTQGHSPQRYDTSAHHHHASGSAGAQCANCHMPTTTYMQIDARHDHGLRPPRPDLSIALGTPNACNACHADRGESWAAAQAKAWWGDIADTHHRYANAFAAADRGLDASAELRKIGVAPDQPAIARASAIARLDPNVSIDNLDAVAAATHDANPLVRLGALEARSQAPSDVQWRYAPSLLSDPFRALRIEAVNLLANRSDAQGRSRPDAFDDAAREYVDSQRYSAELPEARANLGAFLARTGDVPRGAAELESAIALHPHFPRAYVDLADVQRAEGDESRAEATLRQGLSRLPRDATLHHALGLALVRMGRNDDAVTELAQAARLDPGNARFAYVYGVALHSQGSPAAAIDVLVDASRAHPADQAILEALAAFYRDAGDNAEAERFTERLRQLRR